MEPITAAPSTAAPSTAAPSTAAAAAAAALTDAEFTARLEHDVCFILDLASLDLYHPMRIRAGVALRLQRKRTREASEAEDLALKKKHTIPKHRVDTEALGRGAGNAVCVFDTEGTLR